MRIEGITGMLGGDLVDELGVALLKLLLLLLKHLKLKLQVFKLSALKFRDLRKRIADWRSGGWNGLHQSLAGARPKRMV